MKKLHIGLYKHVGEKPDEENMVQLLATTTKYALAFRDFYLDQARQVWDIDVKPFVIWGDNECKPPTFAKYDRRRYTEEYGLGGFEPTHHMIWGGHSAGLCGQAGYGWDTGVTYAQASCGVPTMCHETGHMLGLGHANAGATEDDPDGTEYADGSTVMGNAKPLTKGFNSPARVYLELDPPEHIARPTESGQYLLCPIEMSKHSMHEGEIKHIELNVEGEDTYYVSIRKKLGTTYAGGWGGVDINKWLPKIGYAKNKSVYFSSLREEYPSKLLPNGVTVEVLEYDTHYETARVNVLFPDDIVPVDLVSPVGFPQHMTGVELKPKHSGAWYNKYFNGQGFYVQIKDDQMVFYWYTFNTKNHSRRFFYGTCAVGEGLEEFDIYTTYGGKWNNPASAREVKVGTGQIFFFDEDHGVFNYIVADQQDHYNTDEFGRGSVDITPVAKADLNPAAGVFYQPSRNMEGFTVQFYSEGATCVATWYTYGPRPLRSINRIGPGTNLQRWYICVGDKNLNNTYDLTIYEVLDGNWMKIKEKNTEVECGNAILEVIDNSNIRFTYDIDADNRVKGKGTYELQKIF
jgi:hypothetical protein